MQKAGGRREDRGRRRGAGDKKPEAGESKGVGEGEGRLVQHGFTLLHPADDVIVSYNQSGTVYILNMSLYTVQAWTQLTAMRIKYV